MSRLESNCIPNHYPITLSSLWWPQRGKEKRQKQLFCRSALSGTNDSVRRWMKFCAMQSPASVSAWQTKKKDFKIEFSGLRTPITADQSMLLDKPSWSLWSPAGIKPALPTLWQTHETNTNEARLRNHGTAEKERGKQTCTRREDRTCRYLSVYASKARLNEIWFKLTRRGRLWGRELNSELRLWMTNPFLTMNSNKVSEPDSLWKVSEKPLEPDSSPMSRKGTNFKAITPPGWHMSRVLSSHQWNQHNLT